MPKAKGNLHNARGGMYRTMPGKLEPKSQSDTDATKQTNPMRIASRLWLRKNSSSVLNLGNDEDGLITAGVI